ncbi:MAG TPA: hypothetical protein PKE45_08515 [Caldilineaceae bacterium]|nr:hypothetical protein [Caldilineaceae bacterium]
MVSQLSLRLTTGVLVASLLFCQLLSASAQSVIEEIPESSHIYLPLVTSKGQSGPISVVSPPAPGVATLAAHGTATGAGTASSHSFLPFVYSGSAVEVACASLDCPDLREQRPL